MSGVLRNYQPESSPRFPDALTTFPEPDGNESRMGNVTRIHPSKQPNRPHFIAEWAETRGLPQSDLADELGADKSTVSRWYGGASPSREWQEKLAALFQVEPESLFRHPSEDWFRRFFENRRKDEIERIKTMLEAAFPDRTGTDN